MAYEDFFGLGLDFGSDAFSPYLGNDVRSVPLSAMPSPQDYWSWLTAGERNRGGLTAGDWLNLGGSILQGFDTFEQDIARDRLNLDVYNIGERSALERDRLGQAQYRLGEESALARDRLGLQRYGLEDKARLDRAQLGITSQLAQERNELARDRMRLEDRYRRTDAVNWNPMTPTQATTIAAGIAGGRPQRTPVAAPRRRPPPSIGAPPDIPPVRIA